MTAANQLLKIFLVDDDEVLLKLMGKLLTAKGHHCTLSHSGAAAIIDIMDEEVDVVVTDLLMVGMDGFELVDEIRNTPELADVKIVMFTSQADEETREKAEEVGVDAFIGKPLNAKTFVDEVEALFR